MALKDKDEAQLLARARDLLLRAEKGEVAYTPFLTPREQRLLREGLAFAGNALHFAGGYESAERKRMYALPDYVQELEDAVRDELLCEIFETSLVPLSVKGSGYRELSHRDYLGAILNLGIERDAVGDLCVRAKDEAILFCDRTMADFLKVELVRVANDAVCVRDVTLEQGFDGGREFMPLSDTVASPRADAVVAALCNLSRERAQALFRAGFVEIDYEPLEKYDKDVDAGAVIAVRGHGKFIVRSLSDKTKKGRFRLLADRYV